MLQWTPFLLLLALLALFFRGKVVYLTAYAVVGAVIGSEYVLRRALDRVHVRLEPATLRLFPGETQRIDVRVSNPGRLPLWWLLLDTRIDDEVAADSSYRIAFGLRGKETVTLQWPVEAKRRGVYRIGPSTLTSGGPFGRRRFVVDAPGQVDVLVYPRVHPIPSLGLPNTVVSGAFKGPRHALPDPSRVAGIRTYLPGDPMRFVHWPATAHTGELMVKSFEPMQHFDVAVVLDLHHASYRSWNRSLMSELAIEVAASLLSTASRSHQAFGCFMLARHGSPHDADAEEGPPSARRREPVIRTGMGKGEAHLRHALELLARVQLTDDPVGLEHVLSDTMSRLRRETTLFVVAPGLSPAGVEAVARCVGAGFRVFFIEIGEEDRRPAIAKGVGYARITHPHDIVRLGSPVSIPALARRSAFHSSWKKEERV